MAEDTKERASQVSSKLSGDNENPAFKGLDWFKLLIAILLFSCGLWLYYGMTQFSIYVRLIFAVVGLILALAVVFYWCDFGKRLVIYIRESIAEFKKVVWPPKKDAIRVTIFVIIFVAVLSLFIYVVDSLISWLFFDLLLRRG